MADVLFVYGTLMPGHLRWPLIERYVADARPAAVAGRLFDTGHDFPAATFDDGDGRCEGDDGRSEIEGYVLTFTDRHHDLAWRTVDRIEGDLYLKVAVVTLDSEAAHSYAWAGSTAGLPRIDRRWTGV